MLRVCINLLCLFALLLSACGPVAQSAPGESTPSPSSVPPTPTAPATAMVPLPLQATPATIPVSAQPAPTLVPAVSLPAVRERPTPIPAPSCLAAAPAADSSGDFVTDIAVGAGRAFATAYSPVLARSVVYVSDDKGLTWTAERTFNDFVSSVAPSPDYARDRTVFAAGSAGVYRSLNGGSSWSTITPANASWITTTATVKQLALSPNYSADRTIILASRVAPRGVFASTDGGVTWIDWLVDAVDVVMFSPDYAVDRALWVVRNDERTFRRDVLVTVNQGDQWDFVRTGSFVPQAISPAYAQDSTIIWTDFAGGGIYVSRNGDRLFPAIEKAETSALNVWEQKPSDGWTVTGESSVRDLVFSPEFARDRMTFALSDQAMLRSRDGGAAWQPLCYWPEGSAKPGRARFDHLAISPDFAVDQTLFAGGDGARAAVSRDGGRSWTAVSFK
jgi:hypothetical protein